MEIKDIYSDPLLTEDGVWFDYRDDSRVLIASLGAKKFAKIRDALEKPYERQIRINAISGDKQTELLCRALSKSIVLGWEGFTKDGKALRYTEDAAFKLLVESRIFRNDMVGFASEEAAYKLEQDKAAEKNSPTASGSD